MFFLTRSGITILSLSLMIYIQIFYLSKNGSLELGLTQPQVGVVIDAFAAGSFFSRFLAGPLLDKGINPLWMKIILLLIFTLNILLFSEKTYQSYIAIRFLLGFFWTIVSTYLLAIIASRATSNQIIVQISWMMALPFVAMGLSSLVEKHLSLSSIEDILCIVTAISFFSLPTNHIENRKNLNKTKERNFSTKSLLFLIGNIMCGTLALGALLSAPTASPWFFNLYAITVILFRVVVANHFSHYHPNSYMPWLALIGVVASILNFSSDSTPINLIIGVLFGISIGNIISLSNALVAAKSRKTNRAKWISIAALAHDIGMFIGPVLTGLGVQKTAILVSFLVCSVLTLSKGIENEL